MARHLIPKNAGTFRIIIAYAGNYAVVNDKTGRNEVIIACRDKEQAESLCKKLNDKDHNGEVWA